MSKKFKLIIFGLLTALLSHNVAALAENMPTGFVSTGESKATGNINSFGTANDKQANTDGVDLSGFMSRGEKFMDVASEYKVNQGEIQAVALFSNEFNAATLTELDNMDVLNVNQNVNDFMNVLIKFATEYELHNKVVPFSQVFDVKVEDQTMLMYVEQVLTKLPKMKKAEAKKSIEDLADAILNDKTINLDTGSQVYTIKASQLSPGCRIVLGRYLAAGAAKIAQRGIIKKKDAQLYNDSADEFISLAQTDFLKIVKDFDGNTATQEKKK